MKAKSIMIQGTASSVGKSIITAGLCRVFMQDGYKVAPFKSQNMALNSFITKDGKEMGRAQVVQAEAAGIDPVVDMNPILLKPAADQKSQVIINGEVYKNMSASEYHEYKPELAGMVRNTYEKLASKQDIVVIEGAGSPAEINLREKDFVNMGMAEIADAPVILVGDIDKGGVFAAIAGTMLLLTEEERKRVKGVIINKFRGDIEILKPGLKLLEDIIKVPVLGVLPYTKLNIDDEDSLAERFIQPAGVRENEIDVAIIKLPHMSNFTDFNVLECIEGLQVRYVEQPEEMGKPDLIIIPGTKNTIGDLLYIRQNGMEAIIKKLNEAGTKVFGICGGYQMLGKEINDPHQTESSLLKAEGMCLLNIMTTFMPKKVTTQVEGCVSEDTGILKGLKNLKFQGYEIHMGLTDYMEGCIPYLGAESGQNSEVRQTAGVRNAQGNVYGTYIHGIFDNMELTRGLLKNIYELKSDRSAANEPDRRMEVKEHRKSNSFKDFKEEQYNKLAGLIRENLDMDEIYKIIGV